MILFPVSPRSEHGVTLPLDLVMWAGRWAIHRRPSYDDPGGHPALGLLIVHFELVFTNPLSPPSLKPPAFGFLPCHQWRHDHPSIPFLQPLHFQLVRRPSQSENVVKILKSPAGDEASEQFLRSTFVIRGHCCPMRISPNFQRALLTNKGQRSVLLMCVMTCFAKLCK